MYTFPTKADKGRDANNGARAVHLARECLRIAADLLPQLPEVGTHLAIAVLEYLRKLSAEGLPREGEVDVFYADLFAAWLQERDLWVELGSIETWLDDLSAWQEDYFWQYYPDPEEEPKPLEREPGERLLQAFLENRPALSPQAEQAALEQGCFLLREAIARHDQGGQVRQEVRLLLQAFETLEDTRYGELAGHWRDILVYWVAEAIIEAQPVDLEHIIGRIEEWLLDQFEC